MNRFSCAAVALSILFGSSSHAEELFSALRDEPVRWGLGVGALIEDEGYVGIGTESDPMPVLVVQQGRFRLFGPQADFRLFGDEQSFVGLRADYKADGFEASDGAIFEGMAERKAALSLGVSGKHTTRFGQWFFDAVRATQSERGLRAGVYYGYPFSIGEISFLPRIGAEYFDDDFVRYYYGVRSEEALAWRPAYEGDATINLDVGIDMHYVLGDRHLLLASLKYRRFGSDIKDSPLIEDAGSPRANVGYVFRF